jgi:hypothetical protein
LADHVFCNCIGLDDRQGAFDCHVNSNKNKGLDKESRENFGTQSTFDFIIYPQAGRYCGNGRQSDTVATKNTSSVRSVEQPA